MISTERLHTAAQMSPRDLLSAIAGTLPRRVIVGEAGPYLERYTLREMPDGGHIYIHHFLRGDEDMALHNHPWAGESLILLGGYREERRGPDNTIVVREYHPGDVNIISPDTFHRVDLIGDMCWTLFTVSDRVQPWGFWDRTTGAFTPWREFLKARGLPVGTP